MRRAAAVLLLLALAGCAAGEVPRGAYVGGALGGNLRDDPRLR
jgi:hypothetical protein